VAGFRIYRSAGVEDCAGAGLLQELLDPAAASYVDAVPANDDYFYWVRAVDAAGNAEANCETASVTVADCAPPCPPFTIDVTATSGPRECESRVRWTPSGNEGETVYDVLFSADGGPFQPLAACRDLVDETTCAHTGAPWAADLIHRVEGTDSCVAGDRTVLGETDAPLRVTDRLGPSFPDPAPSAAAAGCDVAVTWDPSGAADACSGLAGFRVYRSRGADTCPAGTLAAEILDTGASSHADTVSRDGDWFYWVRAVDAEGNEDGNCVTASATAGGCEEAEPRFPPGGVWSDGPGGVVVLDWTGGSASYNVYRGALGATGEIVTASGAYEQLQCAVFGTSATDLDLRDGLDWFYLVVARFPSGAEQGYGCTDEDADAACDRDRLEAAAPCP
jgi:hypothetical protein